MEKYFEIIVQFLEGLVISDSGTKTKNSREVRRIYTWFPSTTDLVSILLIYIQ